MKRLLSFFIVLSLLFSFTACSGDSFSKSSDSEESNASALYSDRNSQDIQGTDSGNMGNPNNSNNDSVKPDEDKYTPDYDGYYYDAESIVLYLDTYGKLPQNFITKSEANALGWEGGSVEKYRDGAAIGGDKFGNREGSLPKEANRTYTECDIDTNGAKSRGAKRLVFSNDGLYFYTDDHYETFNELYVDENGKVQWK